MICDDCGLAVPDWRARYYESSRDVWHHLCEDCAEGRDDVDANEGRHLDDYECPRCGEQTDRETVGDHERDGQLRRVLACNSCGTVYTRPYQRLTWTTELYLLCVRDAGAPDSHVMIEGHTLGEEQYADIICTSAAASNIVPVLRGEGYRFETERGNGGSVLRTRIRVWPDD